MTNYRTAVLSTEGRATADKSDYVDALSVPVSEAEGNALEIQTEAEGNALEIQTEAEGKKTIPLLYVAPHTEGLQRVFYVSSLSGDDENGEGTKESPYQTIGRALNEMVEGVYDYKVLLHFKASDKGYSYLIPDREMRNVGIEFISYPYIYEIKCYYDGTMTWDDVRESWKAADGLDPGGTCLLDSYYAKYGAYPEWWSYMGDESSYNYFRATLGPYGGEQGGNIYDSDTTPVPSSGYKRGHSGLIVHNGFVRYTAVNLQMNAKSNAGMALGTVSASDACSYRSSQDAETLRYGGLIDGELDGPMVIEIRGCVVSSFVMPLVRQPRSGAPLTVVMRGNKIVTGGYSTSCVGNLIEQRGEETAVPVKLVLANEMDYESEETYDLLNTKSSSVTRVSGDTYSGTSDEAVVFLSRDNTVYKKTPAGGTVGVSIKCSRFNGVDYE